MRLTHFQFFHGQPSARIAVAFGRAANPITGSARLERCGFSRREKRRRSHLAPGIAVHPLAQLPGHPRILRGSRRSCFVLACSSSRRNERRPVDLCSSAGLRKHCCYRASVKPPCGGGHPERNRPDCDGGPTGRSHLPDERRDQECDHDRRRVGRADPDMDGEIVRPRSST